MESEYSNILNLECSLNELSIVLQGILKHEQPRKAAFLKKVGSKRTGWNLEINSGRKHIPEGMCSSSGQLSSCLTVAKGGRKILTVQVKILSKKLENRLRSYVSLSKHCSSRLNQDLVLRKCNGFLRHICVPDSRL